MEAATDIPIDCPRCGEHFKFPREGIGQTAPCPFCGVAVELMESKPQAAPRPQKEPAKSNAARLLKYSRSSGGVETWLDFFSMAFPFCGVIGGGLVLYSAFADGFNLMLCVVGVAAIVQGVCVGVLFKALADIVRLLKKQNGLKYSGAVSENTMKDAYQCGNCSETVWAALTHCPACGAKFYK